MSSWVPPLSNQDARAASAAPSAFTVAAYEDWVRRNESWIRSVEDSLRTMVLFLPGRFGDAEVRSQSIYTAIDLLSFYHDCILNRPRISLQCGPENAEVKTIKVFLNAIQIVEVLIEMMATRQLSRDQKWLIILMIESAKTLARLFLLHRNRGNMLLLGMSPVELVEPPIQMQAAAGNLPESVPFRDLIQLYASRGRGVHNPHGSFTKWTLPQPAPEVPWASAEGACAEVLNIVRPCAYAIVRYFCADESWKPFLLSLALDVSSRVFVGELSRLSRPQQEEVARRMMLWSYYFLRSPLFDKFTKTPLSWVLGLLGRIPLIGVVFGNLFDLALELRNHHFYISASS